MGLKIRSDPSHPAGGYAILTSDAGSLPASIAIEDRSREECLNESGQWTRKRVLLEVEQIDAGNVRLGPTIVDNILSDSPIVIYGPNGNTLDTLVWPVIRPSAGAAIGAVLAGRRAIEETKQTIEPPRPTDPPPPPPPPPPAPPTPVPPAPPVAKPPAASPAVRAPAQVPAPSPGRRNFWLPVGITLAVLLALFLLGRDSQVEQNLVCDHGGSLYGVTLGGLLAACHKTPPAAAEDADGKAYAAFLSCAAGQNSCPARDCANTYLVGFPQGKHLADVKKIHDDADRQCKGDETASREAKTFADLQSCLAGKSACDQYICFDRYQSDLTTEPYSSNVRRSRTAATTACESARDEDRAFESFSRCVAASAACDAPACDQQFGGPLHSGPHAADVQRLLDNARATCAPAPSPSPATPSQTPEQAASDFLQKYYRVLGELGEGADGSFGSLYGSSVTLKGMHSGREIIPGTVLAARKQSDFSKFLGARFSVRRDSMKVNCDTQGQKCMVDAVIDGVFIKPNGTHQNTYRTRFVFADVLTDPRVVYEETAPYP